MLQIKKRSGNIVDFDKSKIVTAINKAFIEVDGMLYETDTADDIANNIEERLIKNNFTPEVEQIQDWVEEYLMRSERQDVARSYIRFRYKKEMARNDYQELMNAIEERISGKNNEKKNANLDEVSFGGRMGEVNTLITRKYATDKIVSEMARNNHYNNEIYIHDLDYYAVGCHNCLSVPFDDLLANGFNTRQTDIRAANSVNTAFQLLAVIFQIQSLQQFGGVSATHLDWTMEPYVKKSFRKYWLEGVKHIAPYLPHFPSNWKQVETELSIKDYPDYDDCAPVFYYALEKTEKELKQAVEGMYHNLNSLQSRSGNQLPFTSINYGTCTSKEGRMVIKALLEGSIAGVGKLHKTSIFPCNIFQVMKGVNKEPGTPNYDLFQLALKSTAQRLYPNYANVDWSGNAGYDINDPTTYFSTMGCRTANGFDINGLGQQKDGRGNICPVTIILPTLAKQAWDYIVYNVSDMCESTEEIEDLIVNRFMDLLDTKIHEAKDMLLERFEYICSQPMESARFMYENNLMAGYIPEEGIRSALRHGTLAIGQLGLAEALQLMIACDHTDPKGMELAKRIEQLFKDRCAEFKEEYKLNFGVYFTPAENLCYTAMKKFKEKYGVIPYVSDKDFFTNSMHVPVWKEISAFDKIDIESQLTGYSSAGCITYVELDSTVKNNLEALETIVNYAMDHDVPYFAVNVPNDTCLSCGYTDELNDTCPMCDGTEIQRLRRVTG